MNIDTLFNNLETKSVELSLNKKNLEQKEKQLSEIIETLTDLEEVRTIFQTASQLTQKQLSEKVSTIVTSALAAVFPDPYSFKIEFPIRRNVTECDLYFEKNGKLRTPLNSCGYGVADIASLALRVAYWKLDSESRNVLILDEPTRNLDVTKQPLASMMIKTLSKMPGGLQFLIITHNQALKESADKVFRVTQEDGISTIKEENEKYK